MIDAESSDDKDDELTSVRCGKHEGDLITRNCRNESGS